MTASASGRRRKREQWVDALEVIFQELSNAYWHRGIFEELRDEVVARNPTANGAFLFSYDRLYAGWTMMMLRRLADHDDRNVSLWRILDGIRRDPMCVARVDYVAHDGDDVGSAEADANFTAQFGAGAFVDPARVEQYQARLETDLAAVTAYVNENVAHRSTKRRVQNVPTRDLSKAVDDVVAIDHDVRRMLLQPRPIYSMLHTAPTWRASMRGLFP